MSSTPRRTSQRERIVEELQALDAFVAAQALHHRLVTAGARISRSTVYRTLHLLEIHQAVDVIINNGAGQRLYRFRPGPQHRHYLTCQTCGLSLPVDAAIVEDWAEHIRKSSGFANVEHTVELAGTCAACAAASDQQQP